MTQFVHHFVPAPAPASTSAATAAATAPTVLALHGTGGTENDLIPLAQSLWPGASILAVRGRISENGAARFFRRLSEGVFDLENLHQETAALADFVAQSATQLGFDAQNVWALGYSNGANIAASLLLSRPETLAGAILLRAMTPFSPSELPNLTGKPIFLAAGRFDPLVPAENIENLASMLEKSGANVTLRWENASHGLVGHEIDEARHFLAEKIV
ncbi:MAG TPA: alpha/beta hydrolase [Abditibacterium sp.]|jgi:predicted esterase